LSDEYRQYREGLAWPELTVIGHTKRASNDIRDNSCKHRIIIYPQMDKNLAGMPYFGSMQEAFHLLLPIQFQPLQTMWTKILLPQLLYFQKNYCGMW